MTEKEMFDNLISKDPTPGVKNRLSKTEDGKFILIPSWITETDEPDGYHKIKDKGGLRKLYIEFNLTGQILYDVLNLGLTNIEDRPKCPICGKECNFRNLFGEHSGYCRSCPGSCQYQLNKVNLLSEEAITKGHQTRLKNGAYDRLVTDSYWKGKKQPKEMIEKRVSKMIGRKATLETRQKQSLSMKEYFKNPEAHAKASAGQVERFRKHPEDLDKFLNSNKKYKRGVLKIKKSPTGEFKYLSSWEEKVVSVLDNMDEVVKIETPKSIAYTFKDVIHYYFPDIDITLSTGMHLLIEIKPIIHLHHEKNMAKYKAGQDFVLFNKDTYCDYIILTENIIFENPKRLLGDIDEPYIKYIISSYIDKNN